MTTQKIAREAVADLLERIAQHARKYVLAGLSIHFDGQFYRVSVEGSGELLDLSDIEAPTTVNSEDG